MGGLFSWHSNEERLQMQLQKVRAVVRQLERARQRERERADELHIDAKNALFVRHNRAEAAQRKREQFAAETRVVHFARLAEDVRATETLLVTAHTQASVASVFLETDRVLARVTAALKPTLAATVDKSRLLLTTHAELMADVAAEAVGDAADDAAPDAASVDDFVANELAALEEAALEALPPTAVKIQRARTAAGAGKKKTTNTLD